MVRSLFTLIPALPGALALWCIPAGALAQSVEYNLDDNEGWVEVARPEPGTPEAVIAEARSILVDGSPGRAYAIIDKWIRENDPKSENPRVKTDRGIEYVGGDSPWLPNAYLLRGDCLLAMDREWHALADYEINIAERFPESEVFPVALERQFGIAKLYLGGLRRRLLGFRLESAADDAIEALLRIQERMPQSELAERAAIEVMDYYYRTGQLQLATTMSDIYLANYPRGQRRVEALTLAIRANIALYRGPTYDGASLLDAREQIKRLLLLYPIAAEKEGLGRAQLVAIDEASADQLLDTARWYFQRGDAPSARYTLKRLVREYPGSQAAGVALRTMEQRGWATPLPEQEASTEAQEAPQEAAPNADNQDGDATDPPDQTDTPGATP
ncbi:MAG: outer membrane protein assembly factor BamD [Phycisphaeraceae bacterium]|nr:outer membrane protein assembly factor BamD [Phycisphaeraceae bacterium]